MNTTTLRGVFPEPKPTYRRNFIKENVKSIRHMQSFLQEAGVIQPRPSRDDKFQNVPPTLRSRNMTPQRQRSQSRDKSNKSYMRRTSNYKKDPNANVIKPRPVKEKAEHEEKFTDRSMQTERTDDPGKLYETGVIKYPSPGTVKGKAQGVGPVKMKGDGGNLDRMTAVSIEKDMQNLELEGKDYIKENMQNIKPKVLKQTASKVPAQAPPTYQRGVVPKYIRERKEEEGQKEEEDENCPEGHVLLPEEERKETLRILRQSYADRIQELNSLPVRSDTLRVKKRKMDIEEELKRIDGGIKVFQRPKVYVKINA